MLNAELSKADGGGTAQPAQAEAPASDRRASLTDTGALEIVETSDVDASALSLAAALPQLPPAALPEPSNLAAMEQAMAELAATHDLTAVEEAELAAELGATGDPDAQPVGTNGLDVVLQLDQPVALDIQPVTLVLSEADVVRVPHTSRSTLVFGSIEQIGRIKGKRAKAANQPATALEAMDLFAALDTPAQLQLTLF